MPTPEEVNEAVRQLQAHFDNPKAQAAYREILEAPIQTERRQSSPEYRERVHRIAENTLEHWDGDYDAAAEAVEKAAATSRGSDRLTSLVQDVASLLRRRAETVKGMRVP